MVFLAGVDHLNARHDVQTVPVLQRVFPQPGGVLVRDVLQEFVRPPCGELVAAVQPERGAPVALLPVPVLDEF